jgi:MFS family permease
MIAATRTAADSNVRRFIGFRIFFNARFYYPVIAILFLDYGLTMEQYALLNMVWAVSIVLLEVPSGAFADRIGRRRMVVLASVLMIVEMAVLSFAPVGPSPLVFALFLLNRFLSGAAEACASGADEALAYDALLDEERGGEWPSVLDRLMRLQSVAFVIAMIAGAAIYDPALLNSVGHAFGMDWGLTQRMTMRFPALATLGMSIGAFLFALGMQEPIHGRSDEVSTWKATWRAGRWILRTRAAFLVILIAVCCDSVARLLMTFSSEYFRLVEIPEYTFGFLGAAMSALGFLAAPVGKRMVGTFTAKTNFASLSVLIFGSLLGAGFALPIVGAIFMLTLGAAMFLLGFFLSHYLNAIVSSSMRATVLSFKGLAMNIAFGAISLFFAGLLRTLKLSDGGNAFAEALQWLPWYFLVTILGLAIFAVFSSRKVEFRTEIYD